MDRDDRSPVATFFSPAPLVADQSAELTESAAHHARVKRLAAGDLLRLSDGRGTLAVGRLTSLGKNRVTVAVDSVTRLSAPMPIHLRVPIGDRDRMLMLAEKATELGVASWQAVRFRRSLSVSPRGEGSAFAAKVEARMISALEQSAGAWLPRRLDDCSVEDVDAGDSDVRVLLDQDGPPLLKRGVMGAAALLFGPEGGLEPAERELLEANGWLPARLAETTLRFETAGIAAIAVVRAVQLANP